MNIDVGEPAIASLRRATRDRHTALEAVLRLDSMMSDPVPAPWPVDQTRRASWTSTQLLASQRRYLDALRGFELFLSAWEPCVEAALHPTLRRWFTSRSKLGLLRRDLALLLDRQMDDRDAAEVCDQAVSRIDLGGAAATFGSLYVLEGSALGGQLIARAVQATLGLGPGTGAAYFNGDGRKTGARWAEFRALLEEQVEAGPAACRQACDAACQTFDALIATFGHLCRDNAPA